jgi:hypothetical protein
LKPTGASWRSRRISHDCAIGEDTFSEVVRPIEINGQRAAGLRFGGARVQALFAVLTVFSLQLRGFTNAQMRALLAQMLGSDPANYPAGRMTYDLRRLRLHGMIEHVPQSHRLWCGDGVAGPRSGSGRDDGSSPGYQRLGSFHGLQFVLGDHLTFFAVFLISVDLPQIVLRAQNVASRQDGRQDRVVLIVITVHPVPADELEIRYRADETLDRGKTPLIRGIVNRIRLRHAKNGAVNYGLGPN